MAKHNRDTLKNYFREGALPTSAHFADLIDSNLNTLEEGFDKTARDGFKVASLDREDQLVSFYRENVYGEPLWSISFDDKIDALLFKRTTTDENNEKIVRKPVLALSQDSKVGINTTAPQQALDVAGVVRMQGRMGSLFSVSGQDKAPVDDGLKVIDADIPADGNWHQITPMLEGCHALEIVAGVGIQWTGQYAMVHAIAMNTCDPRGPFSWLYRWLPFLNRKNPIRCHHAYYRSGSDKLQLKWVEDQNPPPVVGTRQIRRYYLAIKTNSAYQQKVNIRYHITRLWFDDYMKEGEVADDR